MDYTLIHQKINGIKYKTRTYLMSKGNGDDEEEQLDWNGFTNHLEISSFSLIGMISGRIFRETKEEMKMMAQILNLNGMSTSTES